MGFDYTSLLIGLFVGFFVGMIVMAVIFDRSNREYIESLRKEIETNSNNYFVAVNKLEAQVTELKHELSVQHNVAKTLGENNQRLLKSNKELLKGEQE